MPNPVTKAQTTKAINDTLAQLDPQGLPIENLDTDAISNKEWSCNDFSPAVLREVCTITGTNPETLVTTRYAQGAELPAQFNDSTFVNISTLGDPSGLNHNFNILVSDGITYLIQTFIEHQVNIVRRFSNADFITNWNNLSNNVNWKESYNALFGVAPANVVEEPPENVWLQNQYVTL